MTTFELPSLRSIRSIKRVAEHLITPALKMVFNPASLKTVLFSGESGTTDVRDSIYADPSAIQKTMTTSSTKPSSDYASDTTLQELEYKTSYM